jgi:hypothetical protein
VVGKLVDDYGTDSSAKQLTVPVTGGSASSLGLLRGIEDAGIPVVDFQYRRPTLDDVFLTHTYGTTA